MSDYIEYLKWRGDLSCEAVPFCEVDALILCELVYMDMAVHISPEFVYGETDVAKLCKYHTLTQKPEGIIETSLFALAKAVINCPRIASMKVCGYVNEIDTKEQKQFAAATFRVTEDLSFVAFRGTDESLVGWKENMDLAYFEEIPSQKSAVQYLNRAAESLEDRLIVGGHSKGGNLAVYATAFSEPETSAAVTAVYNFDGPGFNNLIIEKEEFQEISGLVHTYVPKNSLIGLLLKHKEPYTIVKSTKVSGARQHLLYSWEVGPTQICREEELGNMGKALNTNLQEWIETMSYEEKKQLIEVLYDLVDEYATVDDLSSPKNIAKIMKAYSSLNDESKKKISGPLEELVDTVIDNIKEYFRS